MKLQFGNSEQIRLSRLEGHAYMLARHGAKPFDLGMPSADCGGCLHYLAGTLSGKGVGCRRYHEETGLTMHVRPRAQACGSFQ